MIDLIVKSQERFFWGGKMRERQSGQSNVLPSCGTLDAFPHLWPLPFHCSVGCVSQFLSLLLKEKPFRAHPSVGGDRPEMLISFFLHKPGRSKYEGEEPETNLAVHSAGFQ